MKTRGVWDDKRQKFSAQETTPGPKKFREDIETLKIEKKPRDVIAHPHVEKKFWPTSLKNSVVAFGRSEWEDETGREGDSGGGRRRGNDDGEGEREREEQTSNNRLARPKEPERADDRAMLADHTFYAATNQQSNDQFAKMLSEALNGTKYVLQCQKSEAKKSEIPSAWQLLTATMSRADAQTLLPISPGQLKKSILVR